MTEFNGGFTSSVSLAAATFPNGEGQNIVVSEAFHSGEGVKRSLTDEVISHTVDFVRRPDEVVPSSALPGA